MITDREALTDVINNSIMLCGAVIESKNKECGITACLTCKYNKKKDDCWIFLLIDRAVEMHEYLLKEKYLGIQKEKK